MIAAGRFRHFVSIEQPEQGRTPSGAAVTTWRVLAAHVPCEILSVNGREFLSASQEQAEVTTKITLRTFPGLQPAMRINANGTLYNIRAILPDPTQAECSLLMCTTGTNEG